MKNGCKEFISKAMDSINDIHYFDNRLHDITFTQTTLRIALKRGYCVEETMQLLDDLRNYIVYLYEHIKQLEKDKQYLLRGKLNLKYQGGKMDNYIACEQAYKNGYEQGKKDALQKENKKIQANSSEIEFYAEKITMRQVIIARKDLNMSPGKLAAQVSHASLAFITKKLQNPERLDEICRNGNEVIYYIPYIQLDKNIYKEWVCGTFTKTICEAKNKNQLEKAIAIAKELGLQENVDYFLIKDCCFTELVPEEVDENGVGRTLTCIGFKPLPNEIAHKISKKFQLYK